MRILLTIKRIINHIKKYGMKSFLLIPFTRLHSLIKKKTGYFIYKKSFIKYSVFQNLQHDVNIPEASSKELEIMSFAKENGIESDNAWSLIQIVKHTHHNKVEGDYVECGVYKGRIIILLKKLQELYKINNKIYGYDTFEGMTEPGKFDIYTGKNITALQTYLGYLNKNQKWVEESLENVKKTLQKYFEDLSNVHLIKGDVLQTLNDKKNLPEKISILRLDTDFYESTKKELEVLYPKLQSKGVLIIDDYGYFDGSRKAVDEYFKNKYIFLHYVNKGVRYYIK